MLTLLKARLKLTPDIKDIFTASDFGMKVKNHDSFDYRDKEQGVSTAKRMRKPSFSERLSRRRWPCEVEKLCEKSRRDTGLEDFGDPPVVPALTVLADSLEREANLHPLGRFLMQSHLLGLLKTRLRLVEAWKKQGQGLDSFPIVQPLFITGMPRSGSTFLHELLARDPELRAPRVWEVMFPVSATQPEKGWRDRRIWNTAACLWLFRRLVPKADSVYPVRSRTPHECSAIQSYAMMSEEFVACCRVPSYESFVRAADLRPVYQWEKRFLQHLQSGGACRRWVLKTPDHVYGLEALFSLFPDAIVIQTHRNPMDVLKSTIHLTLGLQRIYCYPCDPTQHAEHEARMLVTATDRIIQFRDKHPELAERFVDVNYSDLTSNPLAVIGRIYRHIGMTLSREALENMGAFTQHRSRYPGWRSIPNLAEWGLDVLSLGVRFENYCRRFGVAAMRPATQ